jgi:hypothetical protein
MTGSIFVGCMTGQVAGLVTLEADDITPGRAALRDFKPAYDSSGSKSEVTAPQQQRPLYPQLTDIRRRSEEGTFVPQAGPMHRSKGSSFDHIVGDGEQRRRQRKTE